MNNCLGTTIQTCAGDSAECCRLGKCLWKSGAKVDQVNHPAHYNAGSIECIDAMAAATVNLSGLEAICTASAIKYLWRWKLKGGHEDLKKARWYINRLLGE